MCVYIWILKGCHFKNWSRIHIVSESAPCYALKLASYWKKKDEEWKNLWFFFFFCHHGGTGEYVLWSTEKNAREEHEIHIDFLLRFETLLLSQNTHKNVSHGNKKPRNPFMGSTLENNQPTKNNKKTPQKAKSQTTNLDASLAGAVFSRFVGTDWDFLVRKKQRSFKSLQLPSYVH